MYIYSYNHSVYVFFILLVYDHNKWPINKGDQSNNRDIKYYFLTFAGIREARTVKQLTQEAITSTGGEITVVNLEKTVGDREREELYKIPKGAPISSILERILY